MNAPEPPTPAAVSRVPLGFVGLGLIALMVAAVWLAFQPALLLLPYVHPQVAGLAHLWLPGFLLSASIGAIYQMAPVIFGTPLRDGRALASVHLGLHAAGVVLLAAGFYFGRFEVVGLGGIFVSAGGLLLAWIVFRTFAQAQRRDAVAWSFPLAAGWLVATVLAGLAIAVHRRWPFLPLSPLALLRAHAHLGLAGFFLTLLQGATFQLLPMFTMGELRRPRCVATGLLLTQTGLPLVALGFAWPWPLLNAGGAALIALGLGCSALALLATLGTRRRRQLELGVKSFLGGNALLFIAALLGGALLFIRDNPFSARTAFAYGVITIAGGLALSVLGMLCKIIPFLTWMRAYGPRVGRQPVPLAAALSSPTLERAWLTLHLTSLPVLVGAILTESAHLARAGAWILAFGTGVFLCNAARVASHAWKPRTIRPPLRASAAPIGS